ncbi:MAG TPA: hypothetical protein VMM93_13170 [Vicinamibacterales bacterium]|nr:hypothetical protein [Vicinamibacterales bacterium]
MSRRYGVTVRRAQWFPTAPRSALLRATAIVVLAAVLVPTGSAAAQTRPSEPRWSVEVHGGWWWLRVPDGGTVTLPPGGTPIGTSSPVFPSRAVSSWLFGDGATLLNDVNGDFGLTSRLTPLDAAFGALGLDPSHDMAFGVRVQRAVGARYAVGVSLDVLPGATAFTDTLVTSVEVTRASFESAFGALLATGPFVAPAVSATSDVTSGGVGRDILATVSAVYHWPGRSSVVPYMLLGAGIWTHTGDLPTAALDARYDFSILGLVPIAERDQVVLRFEQDPTFTGVVGGGVRQALSARWGFQVDGRLFLTRSSARLHLDATPTVVTGLPAGFIESFTSPAVQFSNNSSTGRRSSLSGPALENVEVFNGSGMQTRLLVTAGVYVRF